MTRYRQILLLLLLLPQTVTAAGPMNGPASDEVASQVAMTEGITYFEKHVRPLLIKHCYECHSAESNEVKGGLFLDTRAGWQRGGESGPAIVPGKPNESLLVEAVRYESYEMPPKGRLPNADIAVFEKWVQLGAPDPREGDAPEPSAAPVMDLESARQFWAFQLPEAHRAPVVRNSGWPREELDAFVLQRLEAADLTPAGDADRETWLRRITFDLIGLPPTPEDRTAFLDDTTAEARARVVDRLLSSPQFGVHWGRHWLDVARYADSNGNDFNATYFNAWRYRNYVVDAFNRDKPFDQFVREQIAGDLMPAESETQREEQLTGTTFLMIGTKMLSERDKEKLAMDVVDEQIDTVGKAFLGMTLGCARCHDHKFDPIPTSDYYALAGIFRSTVTLEGESQEFVSTWVETPLPIPADLATALEEARQHKEALKRDIKAAKDRLAKRKLQQSPAGATSGVLVVDNTEAKIVGDWKQSRYSPAYVGEGYLHDEKTRKGTKSITWTPMIPRSGRYEVQISYAGASGRDTAIPVTVRFADGREALKIDQSKPAPIDKLYRSLGTFEFAAGTSGSVTISTEGTTGFVIADAARWIPVGTVAVADSAPTASTDDSQKEQRLQIAELEKQVSAMEATLKDFDRTAPRAPQVMAAREAPKISDCEVRIRGEVDHLGVTVERGFLQVASTDGALVTHREHSGRRELADWIARPDNPLTARVMVNRIWQHLLGEGLVRSVDNFGHLGERPSHPELLDTLAVDFVESGWSVKSLIRRIALSRTYGLSTYRDDAAFVSDPDNRLLWRANRKRLPAEALRDSLLQFSGQLDLSAAGSPVEGLGTLAVDNSKQDTSGLVKEGQKRSLYLPVIRNELPPFLTVFDFADPDIVTGRRPETNVPAQAMFLMNNPLVRSLAQATAERLTTQLGDRASDETTMATAIFQLIVSRPPTSSELDRVLRYVRESAGGDTGSPAQAWSDVVQALFSSTEFRMLD